MHFLPLLLYPLRWGTVQVHTPTERGAGALLSPKQSTEASGNLGLGRFRQCSAPLGFVRDCSTLPKRKLCTNQLRNNQTCFSNARTGTLTTLNYLPKVLLRKTVALSLFRVQFHFMPTELKLFSLEIYWYMDVKKGNKC